MLLPKNRLWFGTIAVTFVIGLFVGVTYDRKALLTANGKSSSDIARVINLYSKTKSDTVDFDQFWQVWNMVKKNYVVQPVDDTKLFYGAISGIVQGLDDPHSVYFPPKEAAQFAEDLSGSLEGVGMEIGMKDDVITVVAPLEGSPAERAGMKPGDKILKIDGVETHGISVDEAVHKIRGSEGTAVTLSVFPKDGDEVKDVRIIRAKITIPTVKTELKSNGIMYVRLASFDENTGVQFEIAVEKIKESKAKGIILDLRSNPGGFLDIAVAVASEWVKEGNIVTERMKDGAENIHPTSGSHRLAGIPTIVLVDDGSASASEIVAGALQDDGAATIVGMKTYGKGSVQEFEGLPDGSALKLTIAKWYTPKGRSIDHDGIVPDVVMEKLFDKKQTKNPNDAPEIVDLGLEKAMELLQANNN